MNGKSFTDKSKTNGWDYFSLGLYAFGGLGIEVVYAYLLEPLLYGMPMQEWTDLQSILHWIITCITWGLVSFLLIKSAQKNHGFALFDRTQKMKVWQWAAVVFGVVFIIACNYFNWNGFKVIMEYQKKGFLLFVFQYIYYAFETVLFMLIIVFGQKAFELWFKNDRIPYGGFLCGLTWGLAHIFTKGSLLVGLEGVVLGFILGAVYLLVNKDVRKTYLLLFIMFAM